MTVTVQELESLEYEYLYRWKIHYIVWSLYKLVACICVISIILGSLPLMILFVNATIFGLGIGYSITFNSKTGETKKDEAHTDLSIARMKYESQASKASAVRRRIPPL